MSILIFKVYKLMNYYDKENKFRKYTFCKRGTQSLNPEESSQFFEASLTFKTMSWLPLFDE
jgi:hypothetical protein